LQRVSSPASHADELENHLIQCVRFVGGDVRDFGEVKDARAHKQKEMGTLLIRNEPKKRSEECAQQDVSLCTV
jgi:hypothetical protein